MAQAIKYFSGGGTFSGTPVTVYTCPANTIAKLQLVVKVGTSETTTRQHYVLYDSASEVDNTLFNIRLDCAESRNQTSYFFNTGSGYKAGTVSGVYFFPKSGVTSSTNVGISNAADSGVVIDNIYMTAGNSLQFVSSTFSSLHRHVYTALIIEEPAG